MTTPTTRLYALTDELRAELKELVFTAEQYGECPSQGLCAALDRPLPHALAALQPSVPDWLWPELGALIDAAMRPNSGHSVAVFGPTPLGNGGIAIHDMTQIGMPHIALIGHGVIPPRPDAHWWYGEGYGVNRNNPDHHDERIVGQIRRLRERLFGEGRSA